MSREKKINFGFCHSPAHNYTILSLLLLFICLSSLAIASLLQKKLVQAFLSFGEMTRWTGVPCISGTTVPPEAYDPVALLSVTAPHRSVFHQSSLVIHALQYVG